MNPAPGNLRQVGHVDFGGEVPWHRNLEDDVGGVIGEDLPDVSMLVERNSIIDFWRQHGADTRDVHCHSITFESLSRGKNC